MQYDCRFTKQFIGEHVQLLPLIFIVKLDTWDLLGCTVFVNGGWCILRNIGVPILTCIWWSNRSCTLLDPSVSWGFCLFVCFLLFLFVFVCFCFCFCFIVVLSSTFFLLNDKLDLWVRLACLPFSTVPRHVFWQEDLTEMLESARIPFPFSRLFEYCQLVYLQWWLLCLTLAGLPPPRLPRYNTIQYNTVLHCCFIKTSFDDLWITSKWCRPKVCDYQ